MRAPPPLPPLILVAEDDPFIATLIRQTLKAGGMRVMVAKDGQEALEALLSLRPDVIVLDAMMPRMDGFEVLHRLKGDRERRDIPVLMLTGLRQEKAISRATAEGAAGYLLKPFVPAQLVERVRQLVGLHPQAAATPPAIYIDRPR